MKKYKVLICLTLVSVLLIGFKIQNDKKILEDNLKIEVSAARTAYIDALEQYNVEEKNLKTSKKTSCAISSASSLFGKNEIQVAKTFCS